MITNKRKYQIDKAAEEYFDHDFDEVHPKPIDVGNDPTQEEEGFTKNQARIIFQQGAVWATENPDIPTWISAKEKRPPYIVECPDTKTSEHATFCVVWRKDCQEPEAYVAYAAPDYRESEDDESMVPIYESNGHDYSLAWYDVNGDYIDLVDNEDYYMVIPKLNNN